MLTFTILGHEWLMLFISPFLTTFYLIPTINLSVFVQKRLSTWTFHIINESGKNREWKLREPIGHALAEILKEILLFIIIKILVKPTIHVLHNMPSPPYLGCALSQATVSARVV